MTASSIVFLIQRSGYDPGMWRPFLCGKKTEKIGKGPIIKKEMLFPSPFTCFQAKVAHPLSPFPLPILSVFLLHPRVVAWGSDLKNPDIYY